MKTFSSHDSWCNLEEEDVKAVIPKILFLMLRLLFTGEMALDEDNRDIKVCKWIYSFAKDLVYCASGGKKMTPRHIGLGMAIHQATKLKNLVDLLHEAGNSISYDTARRIDTSIANHILFKYKENCNVFYSQGD